MTGIYVLSIGNRIEIVPLCPRDALFRILPNWYAAMFGKELLHMFGLDWQFNACMRLINCVPVYLLKRPRSLNALPDVARAVEQHVLGEGEPTRA